MKTLLIMRHAKSSWKDPAVSDHDRPLNKRGKRDAPRMAGFLAGNGLLPDYIISSSAERAQRTADEISACCDGAIELRTSRDFYHASPETWLQALQLVPDAVETVMIVGHNPILEELLYSLIGMYEILPTASVAQVEFEIDAWSQLAEDIEDALPTLVTVFRPREIDWDD